MEDMQNSTSEEASLHDALAEAFDEMESAASDEPETTEEGVTEEVPETLEAEESEVLDEAEEADIETDTEIEASYEAPEHWSAEHKDVFNSLAEMGEAGVNAQTFLMERHKEMERAANEKFQEAAGYRKRGEEMDALLEPFKQGWQMRGFDEMAGLRALLGTYQQLYANPKDTLKYLASQFNVSFGNEEQSADDEFADPAVSELKAEINQLKQQLQQGQAQQQQTAQASVAQRIQAFASETDESGNLAHPHFEAVQTDMARLVQSGVASDLQDAYEKAVRLNPNLTAEELRKAQEEADKKAKAERAAKAQRAKRAASSVKSSVQSVEKTKPKTMRDELSEMYDQIAS